MYPFLPGLGGLHEFGHFLLLHVVLLRNQIDHVFVFSLVEGALVFPEHALHEAFDLVRSYRIHLPISLFSILTNKITFILI